MSKNASFSAELKHESSLTKKILERVPLDKSDWKPHEKSMTLGRLASHIAQIPHWVSDIINIPDYDFATNYTPGITAASQEELIEIFNQNLATALLDLNKADDVLMERKWTVRSGAQTMFELPVKIAIRSWGFSHLFHHRGQLSVYLRLLDIPVPGMYGPTADEKF